MKTLTLLYDKQCEMCRRLRTWLATQPAYVTLRFIPLQSPEVAAHFPGIEKYRPAERLVVISDTGDLWRGEAAWITILWALREYREWAPRLAHPALRPLARQACALISRNRHNLSRWFLHAGHEEIRNRLASEPAPVCGSKTCQPPPLPCHTP